MTEPAPDAPPPTPRWVWAFGILAGIVLLIFIILHLTGRGFGSHLP